MSNRMVAVWFADAGVSRAARSRERKVRTPQSSVPDNVREGGSRGPRRAFRVVGCLEAHFTESATENIPPQGRVSGR
jgi:hypothetical protein